MRRITSSAVAFVAVAFLTASHCGNEITAPSATPTPASSPTPAASPTPTPVPITLDVFVREGEGFPGSFRAVFGAEVHVTQGANQTSCVTNQTGHCGIVSGLVVGPAVVTAQTVSGAHGTSTPTLAPGPNSVEVQLP
jgi:hypothetical protein